MTTGITSMQVTTPHLPSAAAYAFLDALPDKIKGAIITYAAEVDYPVEAILEMAIAGFLDPDSISFVDCNPFYICRSTQAMNLQ